MKRYAIRKKVEDNMILYYFSPNVSYAYHESYINGENGPVIFSHKGMTRKAAESLLDMFNTYKGYHMDGAEIVEI